MYGEDVYFVSMRHQKPGGVYVPMVIIPEDSELIRFAVFLSNGVRSAGFNGAIESASTNDPDLETDDWRGLEDPAYEFTLIHCRRAAQGATTEVINTPSPRLGGTYENGWAVPNAFGGPDGGDTIGQVVIAAPVVGDKEWDKNAWTLSRPSGGGAGEWAMNGGGHRDGAWAGPEGDPTLQRGDCLIFYRTEPPAYAGDRFDNISGNPVTSPATALDHFPHNRLPINYHAGGTDPLTEYVHSPTGIHLESADAGNPKCVPSVTNQWRKAREGGVTVVLARV